MDDDFYAEWLAECGGRTANDPESSGYDPDDDR